MTVLALALEIDTDWHTGTGAGQPGGIDALVARDQDGLPFLRGKTLHDLLRDACETAVIALGSSWTPWVEWLFGSQPSTVKPARPDVSPIGGKLAVSDARLPERLRAIVATRPELCAALCAVRPGVKIDPTTQSASNEHLRFVEMTTGGLTLEATCELANAPEEAVALLHAGAHYLRSIGGKRRRGAGRCTTRITGVAIAPDTVVDTLEKPAGPPPPPTLDGNGPRPSAALGAGVVVVDLRLTLNEAVLIADRTVGNQVNALDHVPGASLLPPLLSLLPWDLSGLIAEGKVIVTPGHPEIEGQRGEPIPMVLVHEKGSLGLQGGVASSLFATEGAAETLTQIKTHRPGFLALSKAATWTVGQIEKHVEMYNSIDDATQRPGDDGLFGYEVFTPGTTLRCELRIHGGAAAPTDVRDALDGKVIRLGRSRNSRGRTQIEVVDVHVEDDLMMTRPIVDELIVWLTSDALLVDDALHADPTPDGLAREVSHLLGGAWEVTEAVCRSAARVSWQGRWARPRPGFPVLVAGSVVCLRRTTPGTGELDSLDALERRGLGGRRGEGFGRVVINHPLLTSAGVDGTASTPVSPERSEAITAAELVALSPDERGVLDGLVRRAWQDTVRKAVASSIAEGRLDELWRLSGVVTNSQLGTIRAQLLSLNDERSRNQIRAWVDRARSNSSGTRLSASCLLDLGTVVEEGDVIWNRLELYDRRRLDGTVPSEIERLFAVRTALLARIRGAQQANSSSAGKSAAKPEVPLDGA